MLRKWITQYKNTKDLKKSNWGRYHNWLIEYKREIISELIDYEWDDMFWDNYKIISKHKKLGYNFKQYRILEFKYIQIQK